MSSEKHRVGLADWWYRAMFESSTVPIALADENGLLRAANDAYCAMVGRPWHLIAGKSSREFTHPDDLAQHAAMEQLMAGARARGETLRLEKRYLRPDGTIRWGWVSASTITGTDGDSWTMAVVHDTTERRIAEDDLHTAATTDPLTGLLNRRGWRERLITVHHPPQRIRSLVLAMIDFDRFKAYNDTRGHHAGDLVLTGFAAAATSLLGSGPLLARWGGEEFALALPGQSVESADEILAQLAGLVPEAQTFSVGFTALRSAETLFDCFDRADILLYRAKRDGGNRRYRDSDGISVLVSAHAAAASADTEIVDAPAEPGAESCPFSSCPAGVREPECGAGRR